MLFLKKKVYHFDVHGMEISNHVDLLLQYATGDDVFLHRNYYGTCSRYAKQNTQDNVCYCYP